MRDHPRGDGVDVIFAVLNGWIILAHDFRDFVPEDHRMSKRVGLGRAGDQFSRAAGGDVETVTENALDAVAGEESRLFRRLVRRADVNAAAEAGIFTF